MTILRATHVFANADDARLEMVYLGVIAAFELDPTTWTPVAATPGPTPPPECPPWGCDDEEEDRERRHDRDARPHTDEDAWYSGYSLGRQGVSADAPTGMSGHQKRAFRAGAEAGWADLEAADRLEWADRMNAESMRLMMEHEDLEAYYEEQDLAYGRVARKEVAL